jgi:hypothetical protein
MTSVLDRARRPRRTKFPITREAALDVQNRVVRLTAGREGGPLRINWKALDDGEIRDLADLVYEASSLTGRKLKRFEAILERASGLDAGTFERERADRAFRVKAAELARRVARLKITPQQERSLLAAIFQQADERALHAHHAGVLVLLLASFQAGRALAPGAEITVDADGERVLRYNRRLGFLGRAAGEAGTPDRILRQLVANQWLTVNRAGGQDELRLGPRAKRTLAEGGTR